MTTQNPKPYKLTNPYLIKAIFGYGNPENGVLKDCNGYVSANDTYNLGRVFLEFCYSKIFNIHRLPGYKTDWMIRQYDYYHMENLENASPDLIESACVELEDMYTYIQKFFKSNNITNLKLKRMAQPFEIGEYLNQVNNKETYIMYPTNILSSYSYELSKGGYYSDYMLCRKVPVNNIVMIDFLLEDPQSSIKYLHGESEMWVIENDMKGVIRLDKTCIKHI